MSLTSRITVSVAALMSRSLVMQGRPGVQVVVGAGMGAGAGAEMGAGTGAGTGRGAGTGAGTGTGTGRGAGTGAGAGAGATGHVVLGQSTMEPFPRVLIER